MMMKPWKKPAAGKRIEPGVGISPPDVYALANRTVFVPLDGRTVSGILGRNSEPGWKKRGPNRLQPDQTNANHPKTMNELGPKWRWQQSRQKQRVNVIIDENSAIDDTTKDWNLHGRPPVRHERSEAKLSQSNNRTSIANLTRNGDHAWTP
jgi:hypothetical protein